MTTRPRIAVTARATGLSPNTLMTASPHSRPHVNYVAQYAKGGDANGLKEPVKALCARGASGSNHFMTITN